MNTRDLGGYPCAGGVTRWGVFVRSDGLSRLTADDIDFLRSYGVCNTVDLRCDGEAAREPSALCGAAGFEAVRISLNDDIDNMDYEGDLPGSMAGLYVTLLEQNAAAIAGVVAVLARAKGGALFHCAAGKDRTGVVAMLLLKLAGVADEDVVADYAVTEVYQREMMERQKTVFAGRIPEFVLRSKPASMLHVLKHLATRYGSARQYLLGAGVSADALDALCGKFVEPR